MTVIDPYENPDGVPQSVVDVVEEAAPEYTDIALQRRFRAIFTLAFLVIALMGWLLFRAATGGNEVESLRTRNEKLTDTNAAQQVLIDKLATQLDEAKAQGAKVPTPEVVAAEVPGAEVSPVVTVAPGIPGVRGDPGAVGDPGASGSSGDKGDKGDKGATGDTGVSGDEGKAGDKGATGASGSNGQAGDTGIKGDAGDRGDPGAKGDQGDTGPKGDQGDKGDPGAKGDKGDQGNPGQTPSVQHYIFPQGPYTCIETGAGTAVYNCSAD